MNKKFLLLGLMFILCLLSVSAVSDLGTFKQGSEVQLLQFCDSCSYVTLESVYLPSGEINYFNSSMSVNGYTYNYSFNNTASLGLYSYVVCGDKLGVLTCERIEFEVNLEGFVFEVDSLPLILGSVFFIIAFVIFGYFGAFTSSNKPDGSVSRKVLIPIRVIGYSLAVIELLFLSFVLMASSRGAFIYSIYNVHFKVMFILLIMGLMVYLINFLLKLVNVGDDDLGGERKW